MGLTEFDFIFFNNLYISSSFKNHKTEQEKGVILSALLFYNGAVGCPVAPTLLFGYGH